MGNIAIACIQGTVSIGEFLHSNYCRRVEDRQLKRLIPRLLARLELADTTVTTLNLSHSFVDCQILRLLTRPLLSPRTLVQELILEGNSISGEGSALISKVLVHDRCIKIVSLKNNPLGNMGAIALASALEQNATLQHLDVSYCHIEDSAVKRLAISLKSNSRLENLFLEGNHISSTGISSLIDCVYDAKSIDTLLASNHTIRSFFSSRKIYSPSLPNTPANREIINTLTQVLSYNRKYAVKEAWLRSEQNFARIRACKLLRCYCESRGERADFFMVKFEAMGENLTPHILRWIALSWNATNIYNFIKDTPWLVERRV
mmetsp:Transcript_29610/g.70352  ORF Transcript_29610/g.70352 Transcript_29610/m.70352 type:complete len:318 (+) Transcript_29610:336-1289(+)